MIIGDFHFIGIAILPAKADAPWLVDANTAWSAAVAFEGFQTVRWRNLQIIQIGGLTHHRELVQGSLLNRDGQTF